LARLAVEFAVGADADSVTTVLTAAGRFELGTAADSGGTPGEGTAGLSVVEIGSPRSPGGKYGLVGTPSGSACALDVVPGTAARLTTVAAIANPAANLLLIRTRPSWLNAFSSKVSY
jgi:hypothetical protein